MKLYRLLYEDEYNDLALNLLYFKTPNSKDRSLMSNTFNYGPDKYSDLAYRKHFFLREEDVYKYADSCKTGNKYVGIFEIPEELVTKNLGFGNYEIDGHRYNPLEVAITFEDFKRYFDLKQIFCLKLLNMEDSNILTDLREYRKSDAIEIESNDDFNEFWDGILKGFYNSESCLTFEKGRSFFDNENNKKMVVNKVKELVK